MNPDTRAAFAELRQDLAAMDRRFDVVDRRFDATDAKIDTVRREAGVVAEDLRAQLRLVAEIVFSNTRAIERLTSEMDTRFREHEAIVQAAFGQFRRDLEELRGSR